MPTVLKLFCLVLLGAMPVWAQGVVQISSVTADPSKLDCSRRTTARITAQVYFFGLEKPATIAVALAGYTSSPLNNKVKIGESLKQVELRVSPGIAQFEVACSPDTQAGIVKVAATIVRAPSEIKIEPPANDNFVGSLTIDKPPEHP